MSIETLTWKSEIRGRVIELVATIAYTGVNSISDASDLSADLGFDSIDRIELVDDARSPDERVAGVRPRTPASPAPGSADGPQPPGSLDPS